MNLSTVELIAWVLIFMPTASLVALLVLSRISRVLGNPALGERRLTALVTFTSSSMVAIAAANRIFEWHLPSDVVVLVLGIALVLSNLPSIVWLWMYFTDRFDIDGDT